MRVKILFKHNGSNLDTNHTPFRPYKDEDAPLLAQKCWRNANSDWDMPVEINEYELKEVDIPEWATAQEYCDVTFTLNLKYFKGFGGDVAWGRQWFERLSAFPEALQYACIALLQVKNFRSSFRQSLRNQLEAWLNAEKPEYDLPFSQRQVDVLVTDRERRKAKSCATSLYYMR